MKKFAALLLAAVMTASLAACGSGNNDNNSNRESESRSGGLSSILGGANSEDNNTSAATSESSSDEDVWIEGYVGDTISTYWFDFTVNDVHAYGSEFAGCEAKAGYRFLVVDMSILNTYDYDETPMFDTDFIMLCDLDYAYPVDVESENIQSDEFDFLPSEYVMNYGDKATGSLLYVVPAESTEFTLVFTEEFYDDSLGDTFAVTFQVDAYEGWDAGDYFSSEIPYGEIGDIISTYWFDFTVNSAVLYSEYDDYAPVDGYQYLVLEMTLDNTFYEAVPMYYSDFDVEWEDPDSFELPVGLIVGDEKLEEYELPYAESLDVTMIYKVPVDYNVFIVYFDEYFVDGTDGDSFGVIFIPEQQ